MTLRENGSIAPLFPPGIRRGELPPSRPGTFNRRYAFNWRLRGFEIGLNAVDKKKICPAWDGSPILRSSNPQTSHYTNWTTHAPRHKHRQCYCYERVSPSLPNEPVFTKFIINVMALWKRFCLILNILLYMYKNNVTVRQKFWNYAISGYKAMNCRVLTPCWTCFGHEQASCLYFSVSCLFCKYW
jgi:hypothetical protein